MLSKSLIQFSVDGWSCVPSLLLTQGQTMVEVMKIMAAFFKRSLARTAMLSAPNPADPRLHQRLLDTHRHIRVSVFWGHCPFLLGAGAHKVLFMPSKNLFCVLCTFWQLFGGVNGVLQEGLCHTHVYCTQIPCPCSSPLQTCTSTGDTQTQFWLSLCGVSGSWCTQGSVCAL